MATIIFGLVVLALVLWALNAFPKVNPQTAAVVLKTGGGLGALAAAGLLGVRGRLDIAIPLGLTGLGILGWLPWSMPGFAARTQKSAGQVSRVRSAFLEMELDHDTGAMRGRILAGRHEGAALDALDVATLTGAMKVSLGPRIGGLFATDAELAQRIASAGDAALPLQGQRSRVANRQGVGYLLPRRELTEVEMCRVHV